MAAPHKTILIIDDDNRNTFALSAVLRSRGYHCVAAINMVEAFGLLEQDESISLVLMDMMMPGMDGYEAIPLVKATRNAPLPVIAVTAQAMAGDRDRCLRAGANEYLSKPVDIDKLLSLVTGFL